MAIPMLLEVTRKLLLQIKEKQVFKNSKKNKKMDKKLKGLERKIDRLSELLEMGQKATSGFLTVALGSILAKLAEFAAKKVFSPGSISATKEDVNSLKKQNDEILEKSNKLLKIHEEKRSFL